MGLFTTAWALVLLAFSLAASASPRVDVKQYLALRRQLATKLSLETLSADPASYIGKVFEARGSVVGFTTTPAGSSMILRAREGGSLVMSVEDVPGESPGMELGCLIKIGEGCQHSFSDLRLVACVYEGALKRQEEAARPVAAPEKKPAARPKADPKPATGSKPATLTGEDYLRAYRNAIRRFNAKLSLAEADTIARSVLGFSWRYQVDARLVCAVILAESHFRIGATSRCGAMGLGQLMPTTAAGLGVDDAYDPVSNIYGSVRYIRSMFDRLSGPKQWNELTWNDLALALAGYNAGPGAVKKHGGIPPYKETQNYVKRVVSIYRQLCGVK